jgi:hypothetical protein
VLERECLFARISRVVELVIWHVTLNFAVYKAVILVDRWFTHLRQSYIFPSYFLRPSCFLSLTHVHRRTRYGAHSII